MKTTMLRDLFIQPDFDNAKVIISFTKPKGFRGGTWRMAAGKKKVAGGKLSGGKARKRFSKRR